MTLCKQAHLWNKNKQTNRNKTTKKQKKIQQTNPRQGDF